MTSVERTKHTAADKAFQASMLEIKDGAISATARAAGLNHTKINEWRAGSGTNIKIDMLARMAKATGKSPNELLKWDEFLKNEVDSGGTPSKVSAQVIATAGSIGDHVSRAQSKRASPRLTRSQK